MTIRVPVTFEPSGSTAWVEPGTTVLAAARSAGVVINAPCGGRGICGGCGIKVLEGRLQPPCATERSGLARAPHGLRLACHALVGGPVSVRPVVSALRSATPPQVSGGMLVAGVDLGTTGVSAALVDPASGCELGRASVPNAQAAWGADVLSRISAAGAGEATRLQDAAWDSIRDALAAAGAPEGGVVRLVISGNSAMAALAAGADASSLGVAPYLAPQFDDDVSTIAAGYGLIAQDGTARLVGPLASFVGGDTVAAIASTSLAAIDESTMLVDMGTNAEVALRARGAITVTSAPAGPAFEGGGLSCAGPAVPGAVTRVRVASSGDVELVTLGGEEPLWLTGSGVVSAIAALRRSGHLDASGRLLGDGPLAGRVGTGDDGVMRIALSNGERALHLTQLDIRAFQLAKAAVRVAIDGVLSVTRSKPAGVERLLVAGAFGAALDPEDLIDLGIVPMAFRERVVAVGNASLAGAVGFAIKPHTLDDVREALSGAAHVELAADPAFNDSLMRALTLDRW